MEGGENNKMKKFVTFAGSIALLAATVLPAIAAGNSCGNATTGPLSYNTCSVNNTSNVTVNNTNNANINNTINAVSNTGGNSASKNTLGGSIHTGNATLNATLSTVANVSTTTVSGGPNGSGNTGFNSITGPQSDNRVAINNSRDVTVDNNNTANVDNTLNAVSDSGNNTADTNTGPAVIQTGQSRLNAVVSNHFNDSATGITGGAGGTGGNTASNDTTGPLTSGLNGWNTVNITNSANATVENDNDLNLNNTVDVLSRSGLNSASKNTLGGSITTGGSFGTVGIDSEGNISTTTVQMAMGGFANEGSNSVTGPMSDNRTNLLNSLDITVNNPNNSNVNNTDNDISDSGNNTADTNTGAGGVVSGLSDLVKTILNHFNDSLNLIQ